MRVVVQRVTEASVTIDQNVTSSIKKGLLVLAGFEESDTDAELDWVLNKIINMRIFEDEVQKMNKSLLDIKGELLIVSQFTLHASTKKGNRPSFIHAAKPDYANQLYEKMIEKAWKLVSTKVATGVFGAMMDIQLVNSGPVTIIIDSKNRE